MGKKAGFVKMAPVERVSADEILLSMGENLEKHSLLCSDGWRSYGALGCTVKCHERVIVTKGPKAARLLPWVHTMIANAKGILRGVYHGVSSKHLGRYLAEFCYRTNRRFWKSEQCLPQHHNHHLCGAKGVIPLCMNNLD